jgi:alkanesulfonate monooxygenase SsuD/methylene tetrahydromethanopterin reductase-like flavin-dependent oxidoreductase (luciferase family)
VSVWGEPHECVERLTEIIEAGAGFLLLNPVFDELEQIELFASTLAPKL